jgi:hypothetical protein
LLLFADSKLAAVVKGELEALMKPEFLNRIDDIVVFQPLTDNELFKIASRMSSEIVARTKVEKEINVSVTSSLLQKIVDEGSKAASEFGARPMRRAVQYILEDAISEAIIKRFLVSDDSATFDLQRDHDEECDSDGMRPYFVVVSRTRDDEKLTIDIEESCHDFEDDIIVRKQLEVDWNVNGALPVYTQDSR